MVDGAYSLDPDGSLHPRGAGLPAEHFGFASVVPVDGFQPGLFMLDKSAWLEAGGIDGAFEDPAYAAVDLSMRLRAAGRRVICEPQMQAQVLAAVEVELQPDVADDVERVLQRWAGTIEHAKRHPQPRGPFVDHFTPKPDQDAGSNVIWWYMQIFLDIGYRVTFLPVADLTVSGAHAANLRRHGIECVSTPGATTPEQYIRENAAAFQLVLLYRVPVA